MRNTIKKLTQKAERPQKNGEKINLVFEVTMIVRISTLGIN